MVFFNIRNGPESQMFTLFLCVCVWFVYMTNPLFTGPIACKIPQGLRTTQCAGHLSMIFYLLFHQINCLASPFQEVSCSANETFMMVQNALGPDWSSLALSQIVFCFFEAALFMSPPQQCSLTHKTCLI